MSTSHYHDGENPPSPPRLRSTNLPEDIGEQVAVTEPFFGDNIHPILPEDMDMRDLSETELYEMTQKHYEQSMEDSSPLISRIEETASLLEEYPTESLYRSQIDSLINDGYSHMIRAKRDGDCFYRAFAFAYVDQLSQSPGNIKDQLAATKDMLASAGFDSSVYELPYEILQTLVHSDSQGNTHPTNEVWKSFLDPFQSNYIVMYMRLLTSAQMRAASDDFAAFTLDPDSHKEMAVVDFCRRYVEPCGKEADSLQVAALTRALNVHVKIAYLDGHRSGRVYFVNFPENALSGTEPLVLLYRPGHYDILRKNI